MNELGERNALLISNAAKTVGCSMKIWDYIFEYVYVDEAKDLKAFIEYLVNDGIQFTENTLSALYIEWKNDRS